MGFQLNKMRVVRPGARRLGGLAPRECVKGGGRRPERGFGNDAENSPQKRRFLPPSHRYAVTVSSLSGRKYSSNTCFCQSFRNYFVTSCLWNRDLTASKTNGGFP